MEVSFLLPLDVSRRELLEVLLVRLKELEVRVDVVRGHEAVIQASGAFVNGYLSDDKDPRSEWYHTMRVDLMFYMDCPRQSSLYITQVSSSLVCVDFCFFGSEDDEPEWNQKGVSRSQLPQFKELLIMFFHAFDFVAGMVAHETDVLDLFGLDLTWPNEAFTIDTLRSTWNGGMGNQALIAVVTNNSYIDPEMAKGSIGVENYVLHIPGRANRP